MACISYMWVVAGLMAVIFFLLWKKIGIRDIPGQRSSHVRSTPTAAGVCVGFIFLIFFFLAGNQEIELEVISSSSLAGFVILILVGFIDDWKELNYKIRLLSHMISVGLVLTQHNLNIGDYCVWLFVGVGLINACNFLDGLNGLLASQWLLTVGFLLCSFGSFNSIFWILWVVILVYLFFNFPRARIFIGDTGSTILGFSYFIVIFSLAFRPHGLPSFIIANDSFLIFSLFPLAHVWADIIFTIIKRSIDKRSIVNSFGDYGFHYQAKFFKSHTIVSLIYLGFNLLLTYFSAFLFNNHHYIFAVCFLYIVLQILYWMFVYNLSKKYL
ncbi:MAG: hypothetical protein ACK4V2_06475 [Pseudomonadota bacterium]|jgi:UDP-N-acetylmuramyl pentapeptide phosphotransferase/UDP-N-acetylglucosamine-1-phosphate transferase|nr:hypothetical protein [Alphaproteobacteria bacterium]